MVSDILELEVEYGIFETVFDREPKQNRSGFLTWKNKNFCSVSERLAGSRDLTKYMKQCEKAYEPKTKVTAICSNGSDQMCLFGYEYKDGEPIR